ncbi:polyprenyl synthetase family protein [Candidatus Saganbacteria bacterium]|nr:polyprenyl synthetase family protein [Candidatus Saganbacteria bacterium]
MELKKIYRPIARELRQVEKKLQRLFDNVDDDFIASLGNYVVRKPGKRLRPALALLSAKFGRGEPAKKIVDLAVAIELIHIATLVHDDVIDNAKLRRGQPTVNVKFGRDAAILLGDYLYTLAFNRVTAINSSEITTSLLQTARTICQGEIRQLWNSARSAADVKFPEYIKIAADKTAALFAACCETGGIIGRVKKDKLQALKKYGYNLGISFQIVDDCLDLVGTEAALGKTVSLDAGNGRMTLPLIYLRKTRDKSLAVKQALKQARHFGTKARRSLNVFKTGEIQKTFDSLVAYVLKHDGNH